MAKTCPTVWVDQLLYNLVMTFADHMHVVRVQLSSTDSGTGFGADDGYSDSACTGKRPQTGPRPGLHRLHRLVGAVYTTRPTPSTSPG
jgi:hypothetical protein